MRGLFTHTKKVTCHFVMPCVVYLTVAMRIGNSHAQYSSYSDSSGYLNDEDPFTILEP